MSHSGDPFCLRRHHVKNSVVYFASFAVRSGANLLSFNRLLDRNDSLRREHHDPPRKGLDRSSKIPSTRMRSIDLTDLQGRCWHPRLWKRSDIVPYDPYR